MQLILSGTADFMVAEPEDLRTLKSYHDTDLVITHELKKFAKCECLRIVSLDKKKKMLIWFVLIC